MNNLAPPPPNLPPPNLPPVGPSGDSTAMILRGALLDSRQRWRDLVTMAADFAFETDALGRFVFVTPDPALGWPAGLLFGQPGELLLATTTPGHGCNPFRPITALRQQRVWIRRASGQAACMVFAAAPLLDDTGRIVGARGLGIDLSEQESQAAQLVAALRRGELLDHILWCMRQEVLAPRMMRAVLEAMVHALGAEGAAVIDVHGPGGSPIMLYQAGGGGGAVLAGASDLVATGADEPARTQTVDGRPVLAAFCRTRFGEQVGLTLWRVPGGRQWDAEDASLAVSSATIIRVVLEHESIQREMARQARTDPLTGLLNRRAFLEEIARHIDRLEHEGQPGTLIYVDMDYFKQINDQLGHDAGDLALRAAATLLRDLVRPTDLVARLGGDEFALWLNGADQLTAAERGEWLRLHAPAALASAIAHMGAMADPPMSLSVGIAERPAGSGEEIDALMRRADQAMYMVKQNGRGHWRVAPPVVSS